MIPTRVVALIIVVYGFAGVASGQEPNSLSAAGVSGLFSVSAAETLPKGAWAYLLGFNDWDKFGGPPLTADESVPHNFDYDDIELMAGLAYGASERLEFGLTLPYGAIYTAGRTRAGSINGVSVKGKVRTSGWRNLEISAKYRMLGGQFDWWLASAYTGLEVPFSSESDVISTGDIGYNLGLVLDIFNVSTSITFRSPGRGKTSRSPDSMTVGFGYAGILNEDADWITELIGTKYFGSAAPPESLSVTSGTRLWFQDRIAIDLALRAEITQVHDWGQHCPLGGLASISVYPRFRKVKY